MLKMVMEEKNKMANNGIDILTYAAAKAYTDKVAGGGGGSSINVVQTIGSSTEDVMSQDATTKLVFNGGSYPVAIRIGNENNTNNMSTISIGAFNEVGGNGSVSIGANAGASANNSVALGGSAKAIETGAVALGYAAHAGIGNYNVAIGYGATADMRQGQVSFKKNSSYNNASYNNSGYMLLAGVHDGVDLHDAATVAQGNTLATSAPTSSTAGVLGQLYTDTTSMHTYQCTAIDTTDPDNPAYTWTQRW